MESYSIAASCFYFLGVEVASLLAPSEEYPPAAIRQTLKRCLSLAAGLGRVRPSVWSRRLSLLIVRIESLVLQF
jgi:hypothetical protein